MSAEPELLLVAVGILRNLFAKSAMSAEPELLLVAVGILRNLFAKSAMPAEPELLLAAAEESPLAKLFINVLAWFVCPE